MTQPKVGHTVLQYLPRIRLASDAPLQQSQTHPSLEAAWQCSIALLLSLCQLLSSASPTAQCCQLTGHYSPSAAPDWRSVLVSVFSSQVLCLFLSSSHRYQSLHPPPTVSAPVVTISLPLSLSLSQYQPVHPADPHITDMARLAIPFAL